MSTWNLHDSNILKYQNQKPSPSLSPPPSFVDYEHEAIPDREQQIILTRSRKSKRNRIIFIIIFILLILAVAITLPILYLIPRNVSFDILPINVDNTTINVTPDGFILPVSPIVLANNENFFDIHLKKVFISGSHPDYSFGEIALGTGLITNINLSKRSITQFPFLFNVHFNRTLDPELLYLSNMLTNCSEPTNSKLYFDIDVDISYKMWAKSDSMREKRNIIFPCPVTNEEAQRYKSLLSFM